MFKLFSGKSKIKELEAKVVALEFNLTKYDIAVHNLVDVTNGLNEQLRVARRDIQKLQDLSKNIIGTQRTEKAADLVSNLVPAKPSAPAVQIKKVKKVKTK